MWCVLILYACLVPAEGGYTFYRNIREKEQSEPHTRRLFGGQSVNPKEHPNLAVLVDHSMTPKCSGAIIAKRWVLTAAHCATPEIAYIRYNFINSDTSDLASVHLLYQHPKYRVVTSDEGNGMDVTLLHHDVGLIRTRQDMAMANAEKTGPITNGSKLDALEAMKTYSSVDLIDHDIEILGYGRTENTSQGSEIRSVKLKVAKCDRSQELWQHCACGLGDARGVCAGDSGGPVMYNGSQVGVTSMGPLECSPAMLVREGQHPMPQEAASVFTSLQPYVQLIYDTVHQTEDTVKMKVMRSQSYAPGKASHRAARVHVIGAAFMLELLGYVKLRCN